MKAFCNTIIVVFALLCFPSIRQAEASPARHTVQRIALVIGANNGGPEREVLRYAGSDAGTMSRVLSWAIWLISTWL